jgi:hypothetical protein
MKISHIAYKISGIAVFKKKKKLLLPLLNLLAIKMGRLINFVFIIFYCMNCILFMIVILKNCYV